MQKCKTKILISGGGTGGHVYPAIAIADALKLLNSDIEILFVGAKGRMEMEKVPAAGYRIEGLWISGLQRSLSLKNLLFPVKVICSLKKADKIIKSFKPDVTVGVGGYASGPTLRRAIKNNIPVLLQEQNSYPGITNKLLAKNAATICVAYDGMEKYFPNEKIVKTGNPVRQNVIETEGKRGLALEYFGLETRKQNLLIVGGSQGAVSINKSIEANLTVLIGNDLQLIWQTGKYYFEQAKETVKNMVPENLQSCIKVVDFITKMDYAYAASDIVVSRAGAIAISELCIIGKPVIFVPLPWAAEDHQTKNAMALVEKNAALLIKNADAVNRIGDVVVELENDREKQNCYLKTLKNWL